MFQDHCFKEFIPFLLICIVTCSQGIELYFWMCLLVIKLADVVFLGWQMFLCLSYCPSQSHKKQKTGAVFQFYVPNITHCVTNDNVKSTDFPFLMGNTLNPNPNQYMTDVNCVLSLCAFFLFVSYELDCFLSNTPA